MRMDRVDCSVGKRFNIHLIRMKLPLPGRGERSTSYEVIPVTAKHNVGIENDDDGEGDDDESDEYVRTTIQFTSTLPMEIVMPDGGCSLTDRIVVRPRTGDVEELLGDDDDFYARRVQQKKHSLRCRSRLVKSPAPKRVIRLELLFSAHTRSRTRMPRRHHMSN